MSPSSIGYSWPYLLSNSSYRAIKFWHASKTSVFAWLLEIYLMSMKPVELISLWNTEDFWPSTRQTWSEPRRASKLWRMLMASRDFVSTVKWSIKMFRISPLSIRNRSLASSGRPHVRLLQSAHSDSFRTSLLWHLAKTKILEAHELSTKSF